MASKDDRNRAAAAAASDDDEEVALDHELLQEERIMRAQPANSFHSEERDLTGDFSVEDLEGELMRGVGGSSEYHLRSVSVASHVAMGPGFGDAAYGVAAMQPKAASASAMGLSAADFASASSSSSSPSSSALSQQHIPEPPVLLPSPFFLDRNNFDLERAHINPTTLHEDLSTVLAERRVDFVFIPEAWKFICLAYPNNEVVEFRVRLYCKSAAHYALEFQQRDGCRCSYQSLLHELKQDLHLDADAVRGFAAPPPPMRLSAAPSEADVRSILSMVASEYADVAREGLKIIARFAQMPTAGPVLVAAGALPATLACLKKHSEDAECLRCGGSVLSHFAMTNRDVSPLLGGDVISAVVDLTRPTNHGHEAELAHLEVQRQGANAIIQLAKSTDACRKIIGEGGLKTLAPLCNARCNRLRELAQEGMLALNHNVLQAC